MPEFETPVVMTLSNHDPSGSAGIQADIETAASLGCHCTPVITALSVKDTHDVKETVTIDTTILIEQARAILEDMPVSAIKIGFTGSVENVEAIHSILRDYPKVPVVLLPITSVCNNEAIDAPAIIKAMQTLLLPLTTIATPNLVEARELAQQGDNIDACASEILETGCEYLLISGTRRSHDYYESCLYSQQGLVKRNKKEKVKVSVHGCGATLSGSIACYLAHGLRLVEAVEQGEIFTRLSLENSRQLGMGMRVPNRFHWTCRQ